MSFYDIVNAECKKNGITVTELLRQIEMSSGNTGSWKNGGYPGIDKLIKISDILKVPIDYLLGREETEKEPTVIPNDAFNPKIYKITHLLETTDIPDDVIDFIYKALENYKND